MAIISQIKLPGIATAYDLKDSKAFHLLGTTITDVATTATINADQVNLGTSEVPNMVTVEVNDAVIYSTDKLMFMCTAVNHNDGEKSSTWAPISPKAADVGNGTITVSGTGVTTQTFTTNQSADKTITVDVPIKTIKVNDTALTPDGSQAVNITIPTDSMTFKGTVGHDSESVITPGATLADVPTNGDAKVGDTYKVVTDGKYAGNAIDAEVGDLLVCLTKTKDPNANTWVLIPSGDDVDVTSVAAGAGLKTASGDPITTTGTIKAALNTETPIAKAATTGTATDRVFSVVLDTTTTGTGAEAVTTNNLAVAVPAGTFAETVSDASTSNNVVTTIDTAAEAAQGVTALNPYSVSNGLLTINYIVATTATNAVFKTNS